MENSMMLINSEWSGKPSFRALPVSEASPYVECIFDPGTKVFVIISKIKRTSLQMLPKLDEYGQPVTGAKGRKEERNKIDVFQEFYIEDKEAIKKLIEIFAINKDFDYLSFMNS